MNSPENIRTGLSADEIEQAFRDNLRCGMGRLEATATKHDLYVALALTVRDRLFEHTVESLENYGGANARRVAYLSAEYLPGPHLASNLLNLGITEAAREAIAQARLRSRRGPCAGRRARSGQWRTRTACVVLHGFAGVGRSAGYWLRDPLRVRHFRSNHPGRLAAGDHGQVAAQRQSMGDPTLGDRVWREVRGTHRGVEQTSRVGIECAGFPRPR